MKLTKFSNGVNIEFSLPGSSKFTEIIPELLKGGNLKTVISLVKSGGKLTNENIFTLPFFICTDIKYSPV